MSQSFAVLWTRERCRWLQRVGDAGPLAVIFGGPHLSQPSISQVRAGDTLFPVLVADGKLYVIARMTVREVVPADDFVRDHIGIERPVTQLWDELFRALKKNMPSVGHRVPITCADQAAVAAGGSPIRFDRYLPLEHLPKLRLGPRPGKEQPLKGVTEDGLKNNLSFHGHVRRLSHESAALLDSVIDG